MMMKDEAAHSYYAAHCAYPLNSFLELDTDREVEVCVIGGGLAGLCTALSLAEQGVSVVVLESQTVGFGASGRNGGQVIQDYACGMDTIEHILGNEKARLLWQWSQEAVNLVEERIHRYQINCAWQRGYATVAVKPRHMAALLKWQQQAKVHYGYDGYTVWDKATLQQHIATERYVGALYDTDSGHLHPLNYTLGIAKAATEQGADIFEHSPAQKLSREDGYWLVASGQYRIRAKQTVLALNTYAEQSPLSPEQYQNSHRILPVGTYIIATEPLGDTANQIINGNFAICDTRHILDYYRKSQDNRLLFGGRVHYGTRPLSEQEIHPQMRQSMLKVFPQLEHVKIDYAWGGRVDISMNRAPDFRRLSAGLYALQGFSGHGVALTGLAGKITAEAILGDNSRFATFEAIPHKAFPGGARLRPLLPSIGLAYHHLLDCL